MHTLQVSVLPPKLSFYRERSIPEMGGFAGREVWGSDGAAARAAAIGVRVCPRHVRERRSAGWRSGLEVSVPCYERRVGSAASAMPSVKAAAGAAPNLQLRV